MPLVQAGFIPIPPGPQPGFDHADVWQSRTSGETRLYVAHTGADRVDVIDCTTNPYLHALPGSARRGRARLSTTVWSGCDAGRASVARRCHDAPDAVSMPRHGSAKVAWTVGSLAVDPHEARRQRARAVDGGHGSLLTAR